MTHKLLFILVILLGFVAKAQIPKQEYFEDLSVFPEEKVELIINDNLLLAGELLQYKGFVLNNANKPSTLSKILYVSLRDEKDSVVFNHKLRVEKGTAFGDFFIPSSLKTGIYRLIGYTNFSRNNAQDSYIQENITILNTFVKTEINSKVVDTVHFNSISNSSLKNISEENSSEIIQLSTNKKTYGYREKVTFSLENLPKSLDGNFVLSVRKMNPIEISEKTANEIQYFSTEKVYIPELRGELISGVLHSKSDNKPAVNKTVSLTIPGKDYVFKLANTNAHGRFFFSVTEGYNAQVSILQFNEFENNLANFTLVLDNKELNLQKNNPRFLKLDSNLNDWLEERSVQLQIENAYFETKKDSTLPHKPNIPFYNNLGTEYILDEYTRFQTVKETFVEVVTLAAVRGTGEKSRFLINNAYDPNGTAKFNDIPPLVLIDGMQIFNNEYLINYNPREIESIRVVTEPYRYGPKIYSGIIAVITKQGAFIPPVSNNYVNELNLPPVVRQKEYYSPNYNDRSVLSKIPDYRVQLLWQPTVKLDYGLFSSSFFTSDVPGDFEIIFKGFTAEGEKIVIKNFISVTEN